MKDIASNNELFEKLSQFENLKGKISFNNSIIFISFHNNFKLSIIFKNYFMVYIDEVFYCDIEGQDIFESIEEIASDEWIFVCKKRLLNKNKIVLISKDKFDKKVILKSKSIKKIFSVNETIYDNSKL